LGKYLKEGHREFGVPGNVFLQKKPWDFDCNCKTAKWSVLHQ